MSGCIYVPDACFSAQTQAFAKLHAGVVTRGFVANIDAHVETIDAGSLTLPVTVNDATQENAWVCSPLTTYSRYALEETRRVVPGVLATPLCGVIGMADRWLRGAADVGNREAMYQLWVLHREGPRREEAEQWLRRAANYGHRQALADVSNLVTEAGSEKEAVRWLYRAAEAGNDAGNTDSMHRYELVLYEIQERQRAAARHAG